jgi:hypothetical protein
VECRQGDAMNLPVVLAAVSAGILAVLVGSTYLDPASSRAGNVSEAARAALFYPSPIVEREGVYRRG